MLGRRLRGQTEPLMAGSLRDLIPDDRVLARVDRVLDLSWLRAEVRHRYAAEGAGRPGVDPEAAVRLVLAGFLLGIVHDRRPLREAQVDVAIRRSAGCGLHEALPGRSSPTRIRQRWGAGLSRQVFARTASACVKAKIAEGEVVHVDAAPIRADVPWEGLGERHAEAVLAQDGEPGSPPPPRGRDEARRRAERDGKRTGRCKEACLTDPDATMATDARNRRLEPAHKRRAAADDGFGVVLDVEATTGEANEGDHILERVDAAAAATGRPVETVAADQGYAHGKVYGGLERRGIDPVIPAEEEPVRPRVPLRRSRHGARHDILKCPQGRILRPRRRVEHGRFSCPRARDRRRRPMRADRLPKGRASRAVVVGDGHPAPPRARRRRERWPADDASLCRRRRRRPEGCHGEAKSRHGLARAVRRGLQNMRIQAFLAAAAIDLERPAAALLVSLGASFARPILVAPQALLARVHPNDDATVVDTGPAMRLA